MPMRHSMNSRSPTTCAVPATYWTVLRAETNSTSAPDGADPTQGITWGTTGVGDFTVTFDGDEKPRRILAGIGNVEEDGDNCLVYTGYTASTGVVTMTLYTASTMAPVDETDFTISMILLCTDLSINDA